MTSTKSQLQALSWTKDNFFISTDPRLFPIPEVIDVFDSDEFYWAKTMPPQAMKETLENSLSFGLYERIHPESPLSTSLKFIGLARCVTDYTTFSYLTDVWVNQSYRGKGLGSWLIKCINEVLESMPHLRRTMLLTSNSGTAVPLYEKLLSMSILESRAGEGLVVMRNKGKGHPSYGSEDG